MTVAGLIEALQKLDPEATAVVRVRDHGDYLHPVGFVKPIKAVNWAESGNDPGFFEEGDTADSYDVVHIGAD